MKKIMLIISLVCTFNVFAEEMTRIEFVSKSEVAVYQMNSLAIDERVNSLVNDFYLKEIEVITVSPSIIEVKNGLYQFAVISNNRNMSFPVQADGGKIRVTIRPAPAWHDALLYAFIGSAVFSAVSLEGAFTAENVAFGENPLTYIGISTGVISLGAFLWWVLAFPGVKVEKVR